MVLMINYRFFTDVQLKQSTTINYSTIGIAVQCSRLQYNSYTIQSSQFRFHCNCGLVLLVISHFQFGASSCSTITIVVYCTELSIAMEVQNSQFQYDSQCSSVLSLIVHQLQQLSALSYSTIVTLVQCSQLYYNSYHSLGVILQFLLLKP